MHYKYKIGQVVMLQERRYLGKAVIAGYRNSMYILEFEIDHPELADMRYPFVGGREFRGLFAAEHQIRAIRERKERDDEGSENDGTV